MENLFKSLVKSAKTGHPGVLLSNPRFPGQLVNKLSTRSVPAPPNVLNLQYLIDTGGSLDMHRVLTWSDTMSGLAGQVGAIALIQRSSGARIAEILNLTVSSIVTIDTLLILGLKRSRSRSVRVPELTQQFAAFSNSQNHLLFSISYSHVYRQYISAGIIIRRGGKLRNSVTHTYRHNFINSIQKASLNVSTTAEVVGHKSKTSTQKYLNKG